MNKDLWLQLRAAMDKEFGIFQHTTPASPVALPAQTAVRDALEPLLSKITTAADDCEHCIRKDWGSASKDELQTIRRTVVAIRAALEGPAQTDSSVHTVDAPATPLPLGSASGAALED